MNGLLDTGLDRHHHIAIRRSVCDGRDTAVAGHQVRVRTGEARHQVDRLQDPTDGATVQRIDERIALVAIEIADQHNVGIFKPHDGVAARVR